MLSRHFIAGIGHFRQGKDGDILHAHEFFGLFPRQPRVFRLIAADFLFDGIEAGFRR